MAKVKGRFGDWLVTDFGIEHRTRKWYWFEKKQLDGRVNCHMAEKCDDRNYWGPLEDFERALQAAREYHHIEPLDLRCYCGMHDGSGLGLFANRAREK